MAAPIQLKSNKAGGNTFKKSAAIRSKLVGCQQQQKNARAKFGASFIRMRGGKWIVTMTPEQFAELWKAANGVTSH